MVFRRNVEDEALLWAHDESQEDMRYRALLMNDPVSWCGYGGGSSSSSGGGGGGCGDGGEGSKSQQAKRKRKEHEARQTLKKKENTGKEGGGCVLR